MAEYSEQQLIGALRKADAAGDAAAAKAIARRIQMMRAQPVQRTPEEKLAYEDQLTGSSLDPTAGLSGVDRFRAGVGKSISDTVRGVRQLATEAAGLVTPYYAQGAMQPEVDRLRQQSDAVAQRDAALMQTGAGLSGNIAGQIAQSVAIPGAGAATFPAKLAQAGAQGGLYASIQPVGVEDSRATNAAVGGALGVAGQGVASGLGRAATKAKEALTGPIRESIDLARAAGIPLNVAQTSGSAPVKAATAATKWLPFSGASKAGQAQQQAFNRAVARSFGEDAPELTDEVVRAARKRLGSVFDDVYSRNDVALTPDVARRMVEVGRNAASDMVDAEASVVRKQLEKIFGEAGDGVMSGKKYQSLRTSLQSVEQGNAGNNIGRVVRELRTALDDAAANSVGPEDAARLAKVRGQWANLRTAEDALKQVGGASGNIKPAALWPLIRKGSTKEMRALAKIGQNVLKDVVPDSGSAQRILYQQLFTGGVAAPAAAAADITGLAGLGLLAGRTLNSNLASRALAAGRPTSALAGLAKPLPRVLPVAAAFPGSAPAMDIGTVSGFDRNDPRYRGD